MNLIRKAGLAPADSAQRVSHYLAWKVVDNDRLLLTSAYDVQARWQLGYWESVIVAAAHSSSTQTVLRIGPYRFFFYSNENNEPVHIHVQRDRALAKFWLRPVVARASSTGFSAQDLNRLSKTVQENATTFMDLE